MDRNGTAKDPADAPAPFDDPLHGLDGLPGNPLDDARNQLSFLEDGLDPEAAPNAALMDEAYRAAHLLLRAIDPAQAPNVARIAAQVQALVRATRSGAVALGPALPVLLRTAARAARESLEAARRGRREPPAAREAAEALESFLTGAPAMAAAVPAGDGPARFEKVEKRRLEAARSVVQAAGPAVSSVTRALDEAAALGDTVRGLTSQRLALTAELLAAIPEGLAAAARGEPVTAIAGDFADRFDRLSTLLSEGEESFSRLTTRLRQSGEAGIRSLEGVLAAVRRLAGVGIRNVLHGLPAVASAAARSVSREVSTDVQLGDLEIGPALAPLARAAALQCILALCSSPVRPRKAASAETVKGRPSRKPPAVPLSLSVTAEEEAGVVRVVFRLRGNPQPSAFFQSQLGPLDERLRRQGCTLAADSTKGNDASVTVGFPAAQPGGKADPGFLIVKARGVVHAISADVVEECIAAGKPGQPYIRAGKELRSIALGDPARAGSAVIVKSGAVGRLVVVVDELVGEETLRVAEGKKGSPRAGIRGDGSRALILELPETARAERRTGGRPVARRAAAAPKAAARKPPARKAAAARKPAARKPAVRKPAARKALVRKPAAHKPAARKPAVRNPAAGKPAVEMPAVEKPVEGNAPPAGPAPGTTNS